MLTSKSLSRLNALLLTAVVALSTVVLNLSASKGDDPYGWAPESGTSDCESTIDLTQPCPPDGPSEAASVWGFPYHICKSNPAGLGGLSPSSTWCCSYTAWTKWCYLRRDENGNLVVSTAGLKAALITEHGAGCEDPYNQCTAVNCVATADHDDWSSFCRYTDLGTVGGGGTPSLHFTASPYPSASASASPSGSPDPSGSPSPSGSPEPSASPGPSGSPSPSGSPDPSGSPSPSGSPDASPMSGS